MKNKLWVSFPYYPQILSYLIQSELSNQQQFEPKRLLPFDQMATNMD